MERTKKAILIGLILGDGHITSKGDLNITHSIKQKEYIEYKAKLLEQLLSCKKINLYHRLDDKHNEFTLHKMHKYFKILRKWIYKNNIKTFSKKILDLLTPEAIALWWMDDGSHGIDRHKETGKIRAHSFHLYTYTTLEETENIINMFKEKFDINFCKIKHTSKNTGITSYYLKCRTKEGRKLSNLIRPYIIPSLQYKILQENE